MINQEIVQTFFEILALVLSELSTSLAKEQASAIAAYSDGSGFDMAQCASHIGVQAGINKRYKLSLKS